MSETGLPTSGFRPLRWGLTGLACALIAAASAAASYWLKTQDALISKGNPSPARDSAPGDTDPLFRAPHSRPPLSETNLPTPLPAARGPAALDPAPPSTPAPDSPPPSGSPAGFPPEGTAERNLAADPSRPVQPLSGGEPPLQVQDSLAWTNHLTLMDEAFIGGDYGLALRSYRSLLAQTPGQGRSLLLLRIGLCAEATGNYREAIEIYRSLRQRESDRTLAAVARLAEIRSQIELSETNLLPHEIYRSLLVDQSALPTRIRHEVMHAIARGLLGQRLGQGRADLLAPTTLALPSYRLQPQAALADLDHSLRQEVPIPLPFGLEVLQQSESTPDGVYLRVHSPAADIATLIRELAVSCRFEVVLSPAARELLQGRSQSLHVQDQSLSLLLDGLTVSLGCAWQLEGETIHVVAREELALPVRETLELAFIERLLQGALFDAPGSAQADYTRIGLAALQFQRGLFADAARTLRTQMEAAPRSPIISEAAFNLAKCALALQQAEEAHAAFLLCLDTQGRDPDLVIVSHLYAGAMLMELEQFRTANSYWTRGLSLAEQTRYEPTAALLLASGLLLSGSEHGANSVLMEHRSAFLTETDRDAAAFLSALARYRSAVLENRKEREGRSLVAALTHFQAHSQFGHHWSLIEGDAFDELGIPKEAVRAYQQLVRDAIALPIRRRGVIRIARQLRGEGRTEEASQLLASIALQPGDEPLHTDHKPLDAGAREMESQAAVDVAEILLASGETAQAIAECRRLLPLLVSDAARRSALRTMGRAYQQQGEYPAAIQCFTGIVPPLPATTAEAPAVPAVGEQPASGRNR